MALLHGHRLTAAFDRAAGSYDRLVAANPGYHRHLRLSAERLGLPHRGAGLRVLDAGCGTGSSTAALLRAAPAASIVAVDASAGMLRRAAAKPWPENVSFVHSPVEELAAAGVHGPFDAVFCAYLLRNVTDPDAVLVRLRQLLRAGGRLAVHDYTLSGSARHRAIWSAVCWSIVIPAGSAGRGGSTLYRHLWRSVLDFDTAEALRNRLTCAGFAGVGVGMVSGWQRGIVHTFVAHRPRVVRPEEAVGA